MKRSDDPQSETAAKFHCRGDAESEVCRAVATLGRLAGIDVDQGNGPEDIDAVLIEAAYESNFDDPHFLGGPCCFDYAKDVSDVDRLIARAAPITRGLVGYIGKRADGETIASASEQLALIDSAFTWLKKKTVRSP